jgi:hypothetical protein
VRADIACGHPARIQRDDLLVEPLQPGLPLAHNLRLETAGPIPRHRQVHRPDVGQQRFRCAAIAAVPGPPSGGIVFFIAEVPGHLLSQSALQHGLGDLRQQAIRAEQLHALGLRLAQQLVRKLLINQRRPVRRIAATLAGHHRSVGHHVSFREPPFLRLIVRPRHLHSR